MGFSGVGQGTDLREIVPVEGDVHVAHGAGCALELLHIGGDVLGEGQAPAADAHQQDVVDALVALDDLVGEPGQRPLHRGLVHDLGFELHEHPFQRFSGYSLIGYTKSPPVIRQA